MKSILLAGSVLVLMGAAPGTCGSTRPEQAVIRGFRAGFVGGDGAAALLAAEESAARRARAEAVAECHQPCEQVTPEELIRIALRAAETGRPVETACFEILP